MSKHVLVSGSELISKLSPMKRILCLCPVRTTNNVPSTSSNEAPVAVADKCRDNDDNITTPCFTIGAAISDPYLAFASPIFATEENPVVGANNHNEEKEDCVTSSWKRFCIDDTDHTAGNKGGPTTFSLPPTPHELGNRLGHSDPDIGGVVFALPIIIDDIDSRHHHWEALRAREFLRDACTFQYIIMKKDDANKTTGINLNPFRLQCHADERITLWEAIKKAREEPEMWEEIHKPMMMRMFGGGGGDDESKEDTLESQKRKSIHRALDPSIHAAVALNTFLWEHTGGWPNTFG